MNYIFGFTALLMLVFLLVNLRCRQTGRSAVYLIFTAIGWMFLRLAAAVVALGRSCYVFARFHDEELAFVVAEMAKEARRDSR